MDNSRSLRALVGAATTALIIAIGAGTAQAQGPTLSVKANKLVHTPTRSLSLPFVPRGVNFATFEYACADPNTWGYSYNGGPGTAAAIKSWRANTVRVPLNQDCWLGEDGFPKSKDASGVFDADPKARAAKYQAAVQAFVNELHAQGLAVILDLHWTGPAGVPADRQRPMADQSSLAFWTSVASKFKADRAVMFEAFNEPASLAGCTLTWQTWRNGGCTVTPEAGPKYTTVGMQQIVDAIRAAGAPQPIILGGLDWANDLTGWLANRPTDKAASASFPSPVSTSPTSRPVPQLVAGFHVYNGNLCDQSAAGGCWDTVVKSVAAQVPVATTEFGDMQDHVGDTACLTGQHVKDYMTWADALNTAGTHDVGYLGWWWNIGPDKCLNLITDWAGTPAPGSGAALKAQLAKF